MVGAIDASSAVVPPSPPPPPPTGEQAARFANVLAQFEERQSTSSAGANSFTQAQNFVTAADKTGDNKVDAVELSNALNISQSDAAEFVNNFNKPTDADQALDANEFASALDTLRASAQGAAPEASGGEEAAGSEEAGGAGEAEGGGAEPASGGGAAQGAAPSSLLDLLLKLLDADGDGKISAEELKDFISKYDKNGDGKLDKAELTEGIKSEAEAAGLDQVSDADIDQLVSSADTSGDGGLDAEELLTAVNENTNAGLNAGPQK